MTKDVNETPIYKHVQKSALCNTFPDPCWHEDVFGYQFGESYSRCIRNYDKNCDLLITYQFGVDVELCRKKALKRNQRNLKRRKSRKKLRSKS